MALGGIPRYLGNRSEALSFERESMAKNKVNNSLQKI